MHTSCHASHDLDGPAAIAQSPPHLTFLQPAASVYVCASHVQHSTIPPTIRPNNQELCTRGRYSFQRNKLQEFAVYFVRNRERARRPAPELRLNFVFASE